MTISWDDQKRINTKVKNGVRQLHLPRKTPGGASRPRGVRDEGYRGTHLALAPEYGLLYLSPGPPVVNVSEVGRLMQQEGGKQGK